jgi:tetratricopeptide (TPR) repeat protein
LRWFTDQQSIETSLRLGGMLCAFWDARGHVSQGRKWLDELLALAAAKQRTAARAKALLGAGNLAYTQGDYEAVEQLVTESLSIGREVGDSESIAWSQHRLGTIALARGQYAAAIIALDECQARFRAMGDQRGVAYALGGLGWGRHYRGDTAGARPLLEESVAIGRQVGDNYITALALCLLAQVVERQGDLATAHVYVRESQVLCHTLRDQRTLATTYLVLGRLALAQADNMGAGALWVEGLHIALDVQDKWTVGCFLGSFVALAAAEQQPVRALRLAAATDAVYQIVGTPLPLATRELTERGRAQAMQAVDVATQARAWAEGQAMTFEQAVAYALEEALPDIGTVEFLA